MNSTTGNEELRCPKDTSEQSERLFWQRWNMALQVSMLDLYVSEARAHRAGERL